MNWEADLPLLVAGVDEATDWDDVVRRANRLSRATRRRRVAAAVAVVVTSAVLASPAFGVRSWYGALFSGAAATRPPLVVQRAASGSCELEQAGHSVRAIPCAGPQLGPTSADPISDFSVYIRGGAGGRRVTRFAGAVAPGIESVGLFTAAGKLVAKTPVTSGFYARADGLPRESVEAVVGLDGSGRPVACEPVTALHCPLHLRSAKDAG